MKLRFSLLAALLMAVALQQPAPAQQYSSLSRGGKQMTAQPTILACNMNAMTPAQRERHGQIMQMLRRARMQIKDLPDGYALRYGSDPQIFMAAAEFVTLESRCCPFYHFRLEQEPNSSAVWLTITGTRDTKSFIKAALLP